MTGSRRNFSPSSVPVGLPEVPSAHDGEHGEEHMLKAKALKWLVAGGAALAVLAFMPQGSYAVGDPPPEPKPPKDKPKPKPKPKPKDSRLDQDRIYSLGYWQAKSGDHAGALATLRTAPDQNDPRVQTMIGFALRKMGRVDEAMGYYFRALATRPDATTTRQYLGEAYLQLGDVAGARAQLAEIARRCGIACEDHALLAEEIARYERDRG
jgi:tetratricopeptide (TPR) repeat protein